MRLSVFTLVVVSALWALGIRINPCHGADATLEDLLSPNVVTIHAVFSDSWTADRTTISISANGHGVVIEVSARQSAKIIKDYVQYSQNRAKQTADPPQFDRTQFDRQIELDEEQLAGLRKAFRAERIQPLSGTYGKTIPFQHGYPLWYLNVAGDGWSSTLRIHGRFPKDGSYASEKDEMLKAVEVMKLMKMIAGFSGEKLEREISKSIEMLESTLGTDE